MLLSVRRNLAWMAGSQTGLFLLQFGSSLVIARLLTPHDMGVFAIAMAVAGLVSILRSVGLASYLVRAQAPDAAMLASVFTVNAVICTLVAAAIAVLSVFGGAFLGDPGVRDVLLVLALLPLIGIFELLPAAAIERAGDFRLIGLVTLVRTVVATAVLLGFAFAGFSYMSLAYGQVAGALLSAAIYNTVGRQHVQLRLGLRNWREIARFGGQIMAISGVNALASRLAEILLGRLLGLSALGLYSRAASLNGILWDSIHLVVARIVFVDFAEQKRRGGSLRESYLRILQLLTALLWPAFCGMAVIAGPLVLTLYGPNWVGAALPLSLLSLAAAVLVSITMTWEVFVVCAESGRQARFEFVRAGFGLVLFGGGCLAGLGWAAAARLGEALFSVALYRPHLERMTDTTGRDALRIYLASLALTLAAIAPAAAVMSYHDWRPDAPLPAVLGAVALGAACWGALLVTMRHPLAGEARMLLARAMPARFGTATH